MKIGYLVDSGFTIPNRFKKSDFAKCIEFVEFVVIDPLLNEYKEKQITISEEKLLSLFNKFPKKGLKTSLTPLEKVTAKIDKMLKKYDYVIGVPIAKCLSGQYNQFIKISLSSQYRNKFFVFGEKNTGVTAFYELKKLDKLLKKEKTLNKQIVLKTKEKLNDLIITKALLIVNDLHRISLSGRISKVKALIGTLGYLKILLTINEEKVCFVQKGRSIFKLINDGIEKTIGNMKRKMQNNTIKATLYFFEIKQDVKTKIIEISNSLVTIEEITKLPAIYAVHLGKEIAAILITCEKKEN